MSNTVFPAGRDVYSSGEVASIYFNMPINKVEMLHMRRATRELIERGVLRVIKSATGKDKPVPWPGARRSYTLYSVRNHDKYIDPNAAIEHLTGVPPPPDTRLSGQKKETLGRKRRENAIKYGKLGPKIER